MLGSRAKQREEKILRFISEHVSDISHIEDPSEYDLAIRTFELQEKGSKDESGVFEPFWEYHIREICTDLEKYGLIKILYPNYNKETDWRFPAYQLTEKGRQYLENVCIS